MKSPRNALSPASLIRNGFDWSGRTARLPYILVALTAMALAVMIPGTRNFSGANTAVFVILTMLFPIWMGHTRRRLRDVGWSGWLTWVALLPIAGLFLTIFLAFKPGDAFEDEQSGPYSKLGFAAAIVFGVMLLSRSFWAPYWIPFGSMKPTLLVGDFIFVVPISTPQRGDVLVFRHPYTDGEWIMRVAGVPGDTIRIDNARIVLNEEIVPQEDAGVFLEPYEPQGALQSIPRCSGEPIAEGETCLKHRSTESLPAGPIYDVLHVDRQPTDMMTRITVPDGQYFVLGDNRDNAIDSRLTPEAGGPGLIPRENLTGRVAWVLFSSAGDRLLHIWTWRSDRLFKRIQ